MSLMYTRQVCCTDMENDAWMILVFNNGSFTNVEIEDWIGNYPLSVSPLTPDWAYRLL